MPRLPQPGGDAGDWGDILNEFLSVEHNPDGTLRTSGTLSSKAPVHNPTFTGSVTVPSPLSPTDAVTKNYVDNVALAGAPNATNSAPGLVQLSGDLGGTATSPTVPGLAGKANTSHTHAISDVTSLQTSLDGKEATLTAGTTGQYYRGDKSWQTLNAGAVGLGNVTNTQQQPLNSDLTAIAGLAPANDDVLQRKSGAWTNRTPAQLKADLSLTKSDVGLGSVDNTSDANKPISSLTQTALNLKAPLVSPTFTGTVTVPTPVNPSDAATKDYVDTYTGTASWGSISGVISNQTDLLAELGNKQDLLVYTPEDSANRDTDGTLSANLDTLYASQKATKTYADTKMAKSGGSFTGAVVDSVVNLTEAATIAVDASLGNVFTVTLTASRTMGTPTNPTNGQKMIIRISQGGTGSYTITWDSGYRFGADVTQPTLSTAVGETDYIGFIYNSTDSRWDCVAVSRGY